MRTALIGKVVKSEGWDFATNIEKAIADGHPDIQKLKDFAERITGFRIE